ncbi:hypothetical protein G3I60_08235 [Streptomyces sp. SID13666]|nr:hypothetical protein [Streptomyces sp. SID13666]NEA70239.1 hypothetical protein [Streptomyces sp. SID13588]QNA76508.1 hypothetical protein C8250_035730 [Streptomyces sp. So13.3]
MMYSFPHDLLQAQREWYAVYGQLADRTSSSTAAQTTALRRRLHRLSVQVSTHPYWEAHTGRAPAARMALRELARS